MAHLPDVLHLPHIHVDPVMVVIYYCVLYNGACLEFLHATEEDALAMIKRPRSLYQCALRAMPAWRREATGTASDFIAAIMLVRIEYPLMSLLLWCVLYVSNTLLLVHRRN